MNSLSISAAHTRLVNLPPKPYIPSSFRRHRHRQAIAPRSPSLSSRNHNPLTSTTSFFQDQLIEETAGAVAKDNSSYGEVKWMIGSRPLLENSGMEYLIEWSDGHKPADVVSEFNSPWWLAAKKADDFLANISLLLALMKNKQLKR